MNHPFAAQALFDVKEIKNDAAALARYFNGVEDAASDIAARGSLLDARTTAGGHPRDDHGDDAAARAARQDPEGRGARPVPDMNPIKRSKSKRRSLRRRKRGAKKQDEASFFSGVADCCGDPEYAPACGCTPQYAQDEASPPSKKTRSVDVDLQHDIDMRYAQ